LPSVGHRESDQADLDALGAVVATKAGQAAVNSMQAQLDSKQSQLRAGTVEDGHPLLTFSYEDQGGELVGSDTIRALKVSAPIVATQGAQHVHLALDGSLASQSALDAVAATADAAMEQLALTKGNVKQLFAADEALQGELDALAAGTTSQLLGKQDQLTPGTVAGGHPMLQGNVVRAVKAISPVNAAVDTNHVELWLDQSELAATPAIAALQTAVGTKQSQLFAGEVEGGHRLLLRPSLFVDGGFDEGASPDDPLQGDTVRALKVSSPLVATSNNSHVHLSLDPAWSPYWIAGRIHGTSVTVEYTVPGAQSFSIARHPGKSSGIFDITFPAHPNGANYVIQLTSYQNGPVRIWEIIPLTSTKFTFNMTGWSGAPQNGRAFVTVLA
jgi:hypothetical protein